MWPIYSRIIIRTEYIGVSGACCQRITQANIPGSFFIQATRNKVITVPIGGIARASVTVLDAHPSDTPVS